ncbi:hypothetical protein BGW38_005008 [Lunasporangiospora selenospora]|uniref:Pentacotripeptide-repeat region of PRORP domain-containing protein n=1 Tax=Lunasporangiospora selenospora TaxID=979761 RepID=A0A9P6KH73_9FUNG|nr:hypothetical protein BGW38_005008 [Lunasporangiospora selenospora]
MGVVGSSRHQLICKYTTKAGAAAAMDLSTRCTPTPSVLAATRPSSVRASYSQRPSASMAFSTARHFSKSTPTSAIATNLEAELSATSPPLSSSELSSSLSGERSPILNISIAVERTVSASGDMQFLFPDNVAKLSASSQDSQGSSSSSDTSAPLSSAGEFDDTSVNESDDILGEKLASGMEELERALEESGARQGPSPWLNASMVPGTEHEEALRKSIYNREPVEVWWPLYETVAKSWRETDSRSNGKHLQDDFSSKGNIGGGSRDDVSRSKYHLGRTDFQRIVAALKIAPITSKGAFSKQEPLRRLNRVFIDFHMAMTRPKSNVSVYKGFLATLRFWRLEDQIPRFVRRMKAEIIIQGRTSVDVFTSSDDLLTTSEPWSELKMEAREAVETGDNATVVMNEFIREGPQEQYHDLMQVLAELGQADSLLRCLEELKSGQYQDLDLKPTILAYDTVLKALIRCRDSEGVARILQEMNDPKSIVRPRLSTFNILLSTHLYDKDKRATQQVFEGLLLSDIRPNIFTFNLMMEGYLKMNEIDMVYGYYKGLGEYGLVPNIKTYRILMKTYLQQGYLEKVLELFSQLKESPQDSLGMSSEDYRVLMQALADHGRLPDALTLLQDLKNTSKTVSVTTPIYNVFLTHYARRGEIEKARLVLDKIIEERLPVVDGSVNPLIRAYLVREDLVKVGEMVGLMDRFGFRPSTATYNIMIHSTKHSGGIEVAEKLYRRMQEERSRPDIYTFNTMLDLIGAEQDGTVNQDDDGVSSDTLSASSMLISITERRETLVRKIEGLLLEMQNSGIKADVVTYAILIRQYVVLNDVERAEILFREMTRSGIKPDSYAFNTLMNGFTLVEEMDKAMELYRRMPKYGVEPDEATFSTLIKGFKNVKQYRKANMFNNSRKMCRPKNGKAGTR